MISTIQSEIGKRPSFMPAIYVGLALVVCSLAGCREQGPERVIVTGVVSHNGKPVPHGIIRFVPAQSTLGPTVAATIQDGNYRVDSRGGVLVGDHSVQIEAYRIIPRATSNRGLPLPPNVSEAGGVRLQWLPAKYNSESELKVVIESGSAESVKDFDLTN